MLQSYMNPYQHAVQDEINRSFDIQQRTRAGGCRTRCFWWFTGEIAQREIDRNRADALARSQAQNFITGTTGS